MKKLVTLITAAYLSLISPACFANKAFISKVTPIPPEIQKIMIGHSWHEGCPVGLDQLAYLQLSYWGFDNKPHQGQLVVHRDIANDTVEVFKELFAAHFQIERMQLPETLPNGMTNGDADNASGFYCRQDDQNPKVLSKHSYGLAIDLNDIYNPAIEGDKVDPSSGKKYLNRNLNHPGMIKLAEKPFLIFTHHGWYWGGFYKEVDYQHFEKLYTKHYVVNQMTYVTPENQITYEE